MPRWCTRKREGVHLARPDCAQMSEKSTPRRSSEAKAVISAHSASPQLLAGGLTWLAPNHIAYAANSACRLKCFDIVQAVLCQ